MFTVSNRGCIAAAQNILLQLAAFEIQLVEIETQASRGTNASTCQLPRYKRGRITARLQLDCGSNAGRVQDERGSSANALRTNVASRASANVQPRLNIYLPRLAANTNNEISRVRHVKG